MKIKEDVRKYTAQHSMSEEQALESGMQEKSKKFLEQAIEVYANA